MPGLQGSGVEELGGSGDRILTSMVGCLVDPEWLETPSLASDSEGRGDEGVSWWTGYPHLHHILPLAVPYTSLFAFILCWQLGGGWGYYHDTSGRGRLYCPHLHMREW